MQLRKPSRIGPGRLPPLAPSAAARRASVAFACGCGVLLAAFALAPGQARANVAAEPPGTLPPATAPGSDAQAPASELESLEYQGRAQSELAIPALERYAESLRRDDPRRVETLVEIGAEHVQASHGDDAEQAARRIEALADVQPLARPAAMLLRAHWLQVHGEVAKAERQLIESSALVPPDAPAWLQLRLLIVSAEVRSRGGRYDEAVARYNKALRMVDDSGPAWRRADLRIAFSQVMLDAGQSDKAVELAVEAMRLYTEAADEYGISRAYTGRAIQLSNGSDSAAILANWRAALEHARRSGNKRQIVLGIANLADYYLVHGDYQTAYDMSQAALPMARENKSESVQVIALANTGLALISMHRRDEGLPLVREAMTLDERAGSMHSIADTADELGRYLEKAGYLDDALASFHQSRQMSDELNQQDRQRAVIELQEGFANERRQHELDMLSREGRLKDEEILHHDLELKQWTAAGATSLLLLAVVSTLARRLRVRNQQLTASNEQLRIQAEIDPLTGLSNRHHLQAVMAQRHAQRLEGTLYLLDVDHFKQINDACGHAGGDAVLVEIARRLRATLRDDDVIVRWGGEEFLVLVRPLPQPEAEALGLRLLCALAEAPVFHESRAVPVSASIGFAPFPLPTTAEDGELSVHWERAIALVDTAMYMAKARGRNAACGIRRVDAAGAVQLESIVQSLETAASESRVELHLQPGPPVRGAAS